MAEIVTAYVDGQAVLIEVSAEPTTSSTRTYGSEKVGSSIEKATDTVVDALDSTQDTILSIARKLVGAIKAADEAVTPHEFELEFSIKINAEGKAIIAKVGGEASLRVKMTYYHKKDKE